MTNENFRQIIEFAISQEVEAAEFYKEMQLKVKLDSSVSSLKELENMELGHIKILSKFKKEDSHDYTSQKITDLKISDFMPDIVPHKEMTYQEVLIIAMKREEAANKLYLSLAADSDEEVVRNLFIMIADEEARHKLMLETIYDDEILVEN